MPSLLFPDAGSRLALDSNTGRPSVAKTAVVYLDDAGTAPAEIFADDDGSAGDPIAESVLTTDAYGMLPHFWGPTSGVDTLYVSVNDGPVWPVNADYDARVAALATRVTAVEAGGAGDALLVHKAGAETITGAKTFSVSPVVPTPSGNTDAANKAYVDTAATTATTALATHAADTTAIHGVADTAQLETLAGAQAKADTALNTALDTADDLLAAANRRERPARWDLNTDGLSALTSTGLTTAGGAIAATVAGTNGDAIFPIWGTRKEWRAGFRVVCTKATASSRSTVGFTVSTAGTLPTSGNFTFTAGYKAGTGICFVRDNVGADVAIVADASITDGDLYDVGLWLDKALNTRGNTNAALYARVRKVSDGTETRSSTGFNASTFPVGNVLIRTNVAAGAITNLEIANHPLAEVGAPAVGVPPYTTSGSAETALLHLPASPNGALVLALHGHGGSPDETGWTSTTYRPTWNALAAAGFTVAVPFMGGDLWGNTIAQAHLVDLYTQLIERYDLDPTVYIWGNSMGGGAAATLISNRPFPIRAAYLAQPAVDYVSLYSNPSFTATMTAAYPTTTLRDASAPLLRAGSTYAGVPLMIAASTGDTSITKTTNADALAALAGAHTEVVQVAAANNHNDPSHFKAAATLDWFRLGG